jgi:hypothetical protein
MVLVAAPFRTDPQAQVERRRVRLATPARTEVIGCDPATISVPSGAAGS